MSIVFEDQKMFQGTEVPLPPKMSQDNEVPQEDELLPRQELPAFQIFADGACSGNPGPGGWAFIIRDLKTGNTQESSGAEAVTTNNRMELMGIIHALETFRSPTSIELLTDSQYAGKGITEWMPKWKANNWRRREGNHWSAVKNEDLWRRLDQLLQHHRLRFIHISGHSGHPENTRCDILAIGAYRALLADNGPVNLGNTSHA